MTSKETASKGPNARAKRRPWTPMQLKKVGTFADLMLGAGSHGDDGGALKTKN